MSYLSYFFQPNHSIFQKLQTITLFSYVEKCLPIHKQLPWQQTSKFPVARDTEGWLPLVRGYGGLKEKCPKTHVFKHLVLSWWLYLGMEWNLQEAEPCQRKCFIEGRLLRFTALLLFLFSLCSLGLGHVISQLPVAATMLQSMSSPSFQTLYIPLEQWFSTCML